jgi:phytoene dehydrogenase-like protein
MKHDAVVIGSGLGGLLGAAFLAKRGYRPLVLERLIFYGGRFTSFNYKGYEIPTGALHTLPGGRGGHIAEALRRLGVEIGIVEPDEPLVLYYRGKRYSLLRRGLGRYPRPGSFMYRCLSPLEFYQTVRVAYDLLVRRVRVPDVTLKEFCSRYFRGSKILNLIDKIITFSNGVSIDESSATDVVTSMLAMIRANHFEGIIEGGCKRLAQSLIEFIKDNGGRLRKRVVVEKIEVENGRVEGVVTQSGDYYPAELVLSNAGPSETSRLLGDSSPPWLKDKIVKMKPAYGISFSIATLQPLLDHKGIEIPVEAEKIAGYIQVTNSSPSLAPPGGHLLLAYQWIGPGDVEKEIVEGMAELKKLFPSISRDDVINVSVFRDGWAAARTAQSYGQVGRNRYPIQIEGIENLYMVSHDSVGSGFAAEVIGAAAMNFDALLAGRPREEVGMGEDRLVSQDEPHREAAPLS